MYRDERSGLVILDGDPMHSEPAGTASLSGFHLP